MVMVVTLVVGGVRSCDCACERLLLRWGQGRRRECVGREGTEARRDLHVRLGVNLGMKVLLRRVTMMMVMMAIGHFGEVRMVRRINMMITEQRRSHRLKVVGIEVQEEWRLCFSKDRSSRR